MEKKLKKISFKTVDGQNIISCTIPEANDITVQDATNTVQGITFLSDEAGALDAATGKTAVTPKALQNTADEINATITTTVEQIIQQKIDSGEISGGGTGENYVVPPTLTVADDLNNVPVMPTLTAGTFSTTGEDTHVATHWIIETPLARSTVWQNISDAAETTVTVNQELQPNTAYVAKVRYKGAKYGWSGFTSVNFTTGYVITPTITTLTDINSITDTKVKLTATDFTASAEDSLVQSVWTVTNKYNTTVFTKTIDGPDTSVIVENSPSFNPYKNYTAKLRYKGQKFGWSGETTKTIKTTYSYTFDKISPYVKLDGYSLENSTFDDTNVYKRFSLTPTLTLDKFEGSFPDGSTIENEEVTYKIFSYIDSNTLNQTPIFERTVPFNTAVAVPEGILTYDTKYAIKTSVKIRYNEQEAIQDGGGLICNFYTNLEPKIATPTLTLPDGIENVGKTPLLNGSAFVVQNGTDTHIATHWQVLKADGTVFWETTTTEASVSINVGIDLDAATSYKAKVRYKGNTLDWSDWSDEVSFITKVAFGPTPQSIGTPGELNFGVGICNDQATLTRLGLFKLSGTENPENNFYGNYITKNKVLSKTSSNTSEITSSYFVYIPAFCYSFTDVPADIKAKSPYNAFNVKPFTDFADEADANANGYILHRAFIDGGKIQKGFFVGKYLAGGCKTTISGTTYYYFGLNTNTLSPLYICRLATNNDPSKGCFSKDLQLKGVSVNGRADDALVLSKTFGSDYNCASSFMYSALSMLSFAQGLFATDASKCAWFDPNGTTNFSKGNNNNGTDINDETVIYLQKQYSTINESVTRKDFVSGILDGNNFAKITHNGQANGVADLNGMLWQATIGVLVYGTELFIMPESTKLSSYTVNNIQQTSAYTSLGDVSNIFYNSKWGNAAASSFHTELNGNTRALCGVLPTKKGIGGTSEFGNDLSTRLISDSSYYSAIWCAGSSGSLDDAGIWTRYMDSNYLGRSWFDGNSSFGFRPAAY